MGVVEDALRNFNTGNKYWSDFENLGVHLLDAKGDCRSLSDILHDISVMWEDAISAPNLTKSVFDLDNDDIDDEVELATDEDFELLLGVKRGDDL